MAGSITIDDTKGAAVLGFVDDHNDPTGPPAGDGSGIVVTFSSDNDAVATAGASVAGTDAAGNGTFDGPLTPVALGTCNIGVTIANASGTPLTLADGVTAFPDIAPAALTVVAGPAAAGQLSIDA